MATLSKLNILLKIAYPAWPFLIKKIFFSVGQGSGKLSLRASRGAKNGNVAWPRRVCSPKIILDFNFFYRSFIFKNVFLNRILNIYDKMQSD